MTFFVISGEPGTLKFSLAIHMSEQIIQDGSPVIVFEKTLDLSFIDSSQHANIINFFSRRDQIFSGIIWIYVS